jgi:trehalose/maltose transport system substrate-binding protein
VLNYAEEEARGVFQSGNAVFMRNWPYAWGLANSADSLIKDKVGVSALPKGGANGGHAAALGGWQAAVSKYSKNPDLAADLVMYLTSTAEQKRRAIEGNLQPTPVCTRTRTCLRRTRSTPRFTKLSREPCRAPPL